MRLTMTLGMALAIGLAFAGSALAATMLFSGPMGLPETISPAPGTFGSYGGSYFVSDPALSGTGRSTIWTVPSGGGSPATFTTFFNASRDGLFLRSSFGSLAGDYAVANYPQPNTAASVGAITAYQPSGSSSTLYSAANFFPLTLATAPGGFGSFGEDLIVPFTTFNPTTGILAIDSAGNTSTVVSGLPFVTRGAAFAPSGFGSFGGDLIVAVPSTVEGGTDGLLLFVNAGGGIAGELIGVDPRGAYFPSNAEMVFANAGGVYPVTATDLQTLPEPGGFPLAAGVVCVTC